MQHVIGYMIFSLAVTLLTLAMLGPTGPMLRWARGRLSFGLLARQLLNGQMGSFGTDASALKAAGNFNGAGAGAAASRWQRGGVAARTGVGIYTITLDEAMVNTEDVIYIQIEAGAGNSNAQIAHTSATVKGVTCFVAAVATDLDFNWMVIKGAHGTA